MSHQEDIKSIASALRAVNTIAICSHVNPDGDTIGSSAALRLALLGMGKNVAWFCQNEVPDSLHMLEGWEACRFPESLRPDEHFDLLLCVDISDEHRMGRCKVVREHCAHTAQIDHHSTNPCTWTELSAVDGDASACAVVAVRLLKELNVSINSAIADCIYAGISTDTGNFSYSVQPESLRIVADLLEDHLLDVQEMHRRLFEQNDPAAVKLLQKALNSLTFTDDGTVTTMCLTKQDFEEAGASQQHADMIVNYGLRIKGVSATVLAREAMPGDMTNGVKLSFRSVKPLNIAVVAQQFGGGGHEQAAGATVMNRPIKEVLKDAEAALLSAVRKG